MHDVGARDSRWRVWSKALREVRSQGSDMSHPVPLVPAEIAETESKEIVYFTILDDERTVHIRFAHREIGIERQPTHDRPVGDADGDRGAAATKIVRAPI